MLNKIETAEWLIVFDSLKAREQKNRGALIERIKSDFAKFTNRFTTILNFSPFFCNFLSKFLYQDFSNVPYLIFLIFSSGHSVRRELT